MVEAADVRYASGNVQSGRNGLARAWLDSQIGSAGSGNQLVFGLCLDGHREAGWCGPGIRWVDQDMTESGTSRVWSGLLVSRKVWEW